MSCDVDGVTERLENEQLILQPFSCFTYVTAHSPTLPSLYLRQSSFSNSSVAPPTSQLILQPFFRFSYVTDSSFTSPGEPTMGGRTSVWMVFFLGFYRFPTTNSIRPFLHAHLIHFVLFQFINLRDGVSGVVGRHPCYS